ncbi:serine hydrolase [Chitinophaga sp. GCM10012297]|uniref:Serine hydrolase n=1 Tax=Chitinophaga chungangae TaxID=2821488 RepID=A0ABS3YAI3_9BACT|nr:serine hydrolase [Chitinophaga chungangae]MBO9151646.1 serine hydrolase [Chitinophaga chungangae]
MKRTFSFFCLLLSFCGLQAQDAAVSRLENDVPALMKGANIPGMAVALIRDGKLIWTHSFGVSHSGTGQPVTPSTIFEAASLSKVVAAYAVLKLADEGKLNLDAPLVQYLGNNYGVENDERVKRITARMVLSHCTGFPNWRPDGGKLVIQFSPGEKFQYSGEGFVMLSKALEMITGTEFNAYVKRSVFEPLGMTSSSFTKETMFDSLQAFRHNLLGQPSGRWGGYGVNAAASLRTTIGDYAAFLVALLNGKGLRPATLQAMFSPQIGVGEKAPQVAWGLGVGLENTPSGKYAWHWGDQGDSKCYFTADLEKKNAILYFTNSHNGLAIITEMLGDGIGGQHPAVAWLDYERYDPAAPALYADIRTRGAATALQTYRTSGKRLSESHINTIGYLLLRDKKLDDAIAVFEQNTVDFPQSGNVWDSLAEAFMLNGNKPRAIEYYQKSLTLDPKNSNAVAQLKTLQGK